MKKKKLIVTALFLSIAMPYNVSAKEAPSEINIYHPINVYNNSSEAEKRGDETAIYTEGKYFVFNETDTSYNITKEEGSPGGWINKKDISEYLLGNNLKTKEDTRVYSKDETLITMFDEEVLTPTNEIIEKGFEISLEEPISSKDEFYKISENKSIKVSSLEDTSKYKLVYLKGDTTFYDKNKKEVGKEGLNYKILALDNEKSDKYSFVYNGIICTSDKDNFSDKPKVIRPAYKENVKKENNSSSNNQNYTYDSNIISLAKSQVGKSYVFGKSGPNSFDCSGLIKYLFANTRGINLPHSASAQSGYGTSVSWNNIQPGDLLFFGSDVYHVGIYVGNGMYVHASTPERGVVIDSIHSNWVKREVSAIKRI